jgi:hypothetical protein
MMGTFDPTHIKISAGTLYIAPLGNTEPSAVTGAWPSGWVPLGYTDQGSTFTFGPTTAQVTVEEEFYPVDEAIVSYAGKVTFVLAETTRQNLAIALNAGIPGSPNFPSGIEGVNPDGSLWLEPPDPGTEQRVMIGWDALNKANVTQTTGGEPFTRFVVRKTLQTGQVTRTARKGNNKAMYAVEFSVIKPTGVRPFRFTFEPNLDS